MYFLFQRNNFKCYFLPSRTANCINCWQTCISSSNSNNHGNQMHRARNGHFIWKTFWWQVSRIFGPTLGCGAYQLCVFITESCGYCLKRFSGPLKRYSKSSSGLMTISFFQWHWWKQRSRGEIAVWKWHSATLDSEFSTERGLCVSFCAKTYAPEHLGL